MPTKEAKEKDDKRQDADEDKKPKELTGLALLESFALPGPWTEQDEIWFKWMTGETERQERREAVERELKDESSDL
jgi:hypothetical protein